MLWGLPVAKLLPGDRLLARAHLQALSEVAAAGHGWLIRDEIEGICSATGLDTGELGDVSVIAQTFAEDPWSTS
jgi:hypothetical protein